MSEVKVITVTTIKQLTIHGGVLSLTKDQAASRSHNIEKIGRNYSVKNPVQFKVGESFGVEFVPKDMELSVIIKPEK